MELSISKTVSDSLDGKVIALGVTGSIAAVRTLDLVRDLIRRGAAVHCIMSEAATRIIHPDALEYASGNPVILRLSGQVEHVGLCGLEGTSDMLLIAPATANTIGKIACGIDDTVVTTFATTAIGSGKPVMIVPAMHEAMYRHPAVISNLNRLREMGISLIDPRMEEGKAKIADNSRIVLEVERKLGPGDLIGKSIIVTSGATAERVDPIRILTNRASGKTGVEIALEAYRRGADVAIVHRNTQGLPFTEVYAESAEDMLNAVLAELSKAQKNGKQYDAFIGAAAVADYTIDPSDEKIKSGGELILKFKRTKKIISTVRTLYPGLKMVGFKAETFISEEELIRRASESMGKSGLDLVVANDVGSGGMGTEENRVFVIGPNGLKDEVSGKKSRIARSVVELLAKVIQESPSTVTIGPNS